MSMSSLHATAARRDDMESKSKKNSVAQPTDVSIQIETTSRSSSQHRNLGGGTTSSEGTAPSENATSDSAMPRRNNHSNLYTAPRKDIADMRSMEVALVQLLDDFHSGKLQAFGRHCSTEQMEAIRDQQERLAKLHFELGGQRDVLGAKGPAGSGGEHMNQLVSALEQLSHTIEQLHPQASHSQSIIDEDEP